MSKFSGGGGGDGGAAKEARKREEQRKANIKRGLANIERIFSGYSTGTGKVSGPLTDGSTYYDAQGRPITVKAQSVTNPAYTKYQQEYKKLREQHSNSPESSIRSLFKKKFGNAPVATRAGYGSYDANGKLIGDANPASLFTGANNVPGFDDNFFNSRRDAYVNYQTPYLDDEMQTAKEKLIYALSRGGKLNSSIAANRQGKLSKTYQQNRDLIQSKGTDYANTIRTNVANSRSDLINLLNATEDPALVADEATRAAAIQSQPGQFAPLGDFFSDVTSGLESSLNSPATGYRGIRGLFQDSKKGNSSVSVVS